MKTVGQVIDALEAYDPALPLEIYDRVAGWGQVDVVNIEIGWNGAIVLSNEEPEEEPFEPDEDDIE